MSTDAQDSNGPALRQMVTILIAMVLGMSVTYLVPALNKFQPLRPGDEIRFAAILIHTPHCTPTGVLDTAPEGEMPNEEEASTEDTAAPETQEQPDEDNCAFESVADLQRFSVVWDMPNKKQTALPAFGGGGYTVASREKDKAAEKAKDAGVSEALMAEAIEEAGDPQSPDTEDDLTPPPVVLLPEPEPPDPKVEPGPAEPVVEFSAVKPVAPRIMIDPKEWEGITREIEDPSGTAMDKFFAQLEQTALRKKDAVTRISHWGASVIGADGMTSVARRKLQKRFGSAGKGWVNMAPGWKWYRQKEVVYKPKRWSSKTVTKNALKSSRYGAGRYGYGGVAAVGYGGARSSYRVYADKLELWYLAQPKGANVEIRIDDGEPIVISTAAEKPHDSFHAVRAPSTSPTTEHRFEVRAKGRVHLYGVTLERDGPGVVYDSLGMIGTRASRILNYDEEHLRAMVAHRNPNLQIIMYGGNELVDKGMNMRIYQEKYSRVIANLRAGSKGSCLIMTPVDHGEKHRGGVRTVPMLKKMVVVQERVAATHGCGFFNTWQAMGGEGAMGRWYYKVRPRLAWGDFAHLTKSGDRVMGSMIYKALMKAFSQYLIRKYAAAP